MLKSSAEKVRSFCLYSGVFLLIQSFIIKYSTLINVSETLKSIIMFFGIFLLIVSSFITNKSRLFINILLMILPVLIYKHSGQTVIIEFFSLILAIKKNDINKIIKFTYYLLLFYILFHVISYMFTYLIDKSVLKIIVRSSNSKIRHSMFFSHANIFGMLCSWIYMMKLYLKKDKLILTDFILGLILILFIEITADSRTSEIVLFITLFLLLTFKKIPKIGKYVMKYSYIIFAVLSFVLLSLYPKSNFVKYIDRDQILHGRVKLGYIASIYSKPSLFGNNLDNFDDLNLYSDFGLNDFTIDSTYYKMIFYYGIVFTVLYLAVVILNVKSIDNDDKTLCFINALSLFAFMESLAVYPLIYFPILIIACNNFTNVRKKDGDYRNEK